MATNKGNPALQELFARAEAAGRAAAAARVPEPMVVVQRADPLDDASPIVKRYAPVMDGVCGFAWIVIRPGNCAAARYAKANLGARAGYGGGIHIWVSAYNQSYERKSAHASAFAAVLRAAGINAYADSRLD